MMTEKELDIVLNHVAELSKYKVAFRDMCRYYASLMDGDDLYISDAYELMQKFGIMDENEELICDDE
jgi:hypothetical protein